MPLLAEIAHPVSISPFSPQRSTIVPHAEAGERRTARAFRHNGIGPVGRADLCLSLPASVYLRTELVGDVSGALEHTIAIGASAGIDQFQTDVRRTSQALSGPRPSVRPTGPPGPPTATLSTSEQSQ